MIVKYKHQGEEFLKVQINYNSKDGKRHQTNFRFDEDGKRITSFKKALQLEGQSLFKLKEELKKEQDFILFKDFFKEFLSNLRLESRESTIQYYKDDIKRWIPNYFLDMPLKKITKDKIKDLIFNTVPKKGGSPRIQKIICGRIAKVMKSALEKRIIPFNPTMGIKIIVPQPIKKVLNSEEATKLIRAAKQEGHEFYYVWTFALLTGMRNGELYSVRWSDVNLISKTIYIKSSWNKKLGLHPPKGNKCRTLPISKKLHDILIELERVGPFKENIKGVNGGPDTMIKDFILPRIPRWKGERQSCVIKKFCKKIGITPITFHDLRATFITNLLSQGSPLAKVMAIVGHSRTQTTDVYLRMSGIDIKGVTDKLSYKSYCQENIYYLNQYRNKKA